MPHGSHGQPQLPKWYQDRYPTGEGTKKQRTYITAVYDSPEYIDQWGNVIRSFAERFDGHPDLESVDMAYIGPWGEGAGECSNQTIERMTGIYREAHPKTPTIAMITGYKMTAGIRAGAGWRCDCYGDLGMRLTPELRAANDQWNHMHDAYAQAVCECGARDAWRTAPVVLETCGVPMTWYEREFDLDFILQQGLKYHASVFMPKSSALPKAWMPRLEGFCNDLGYRFMLRQFQSDARVPPGSKLEYGCWIESVGVAPIYRQYAFALRFTQERRSAIVPSSANTLDWLPGDAYVHETVDIPDGFEPGPVEIHAGLIDPGTQEPRVRFAVEESKPDGWVPLHTVELQ